MLSHFSYAFHSYALTIKPTCTITHLALNPFNQKCKEMQITIIADKKGKKCAFSRTSKHLSRVGDYSVCTNTIKTNQRGGEILLLYNLLKLRVRFKSRFFNSSLNLDLSLNSILTMNLMCFSKI